MSAEEASEPALIAVPAARLEHGFYHHQKERYEDRGDINSSYSADLIADTGSRIRRPFEFSGDLWVCISIAGRNITGSGEQEFGAFKVIPIAKFTGTPTTYNEKISVDGGEAARNDPNGFYDRIRVSWKGQDFVMIGPEATFVAEGPDRPAAPDASAAQLSLFT